jgi:large conductance mechanosensitive channel
VGLWGDFKAFIAKGSVIQLAVAFVMGVAFTAIVTGVVTGGITPLVGAIIGEPNLANKTTDLGTPPHNATFKVGLIINSIIIFIGTALVVFFGIVYPLARMDRKRKAKEAALPPTTKECPYCVSTIAVKATRCPQCTSDLTK